MKILLIHSKTYGTKELIYDDEDEEFVQKHKWCIKKGTPHIYYAMTHIRSEGKDRLCRFHRLLLEIDDPKIEIDHINHNGLDNRRENLRLVDKQKNQANCRPQKGRSSIYKGVLFMKGPHRKKRWRADIKVNQKSKCLGVFYTEEEAALL